MDFRRSRTHKRPLRRMKRADALGGSKIVHGFLSRKRRPEQMIVGTRFDLHRLLGVSLVQHFDRGDLALGDVLDLHRPARRHIAGLDPVIDDRAIEPEGARDIRLAAEDFYEAGGAVHFHSVYRVNQNLTTLALQMHYQSIRIPIRLIRLPNLSYSSRSIFSYCSGVVPAGSMPIAAMRSSRSGERTAAFTARLSRVTTSRGVRVATNTPSGADMSNPGATVSATVGISGVSAERFAMLNASTRRRPVLIAPAAAG